MIAYPHIVANMNATFAVLTLFPYQDIPLFIIVIGGYDADELRYQAIGTYANFPRTSYVVVFADISVVTDRQL